MEVTCERCSTVYDFDDALVSERGTTVKCTTCSHQFKVRRTAPHAGPDVWIVRTVDGREIEFSALRDLQAAIYENRVTREDVLVRGNSRPRRLGSIAELEPFFNRLGMTAPNPRGARSPSSASTPAANQRSENSVVFTLPNALRAAADPDPPPASMRRGSIPPPPPMPVNRGSMPPPPPIAMSGRGSIPPPPPIAMGRGSIPPPPPGEGSPPPYRRPSAPPPPPVAMGGRRPPPARFGDPNSGDYEEDWSAGGVERVSQLPPPPPPPRRSVPPPPPMFPAAEPPPPPFELAKTAPMFPPPDADPTKASRLPPPATGGVTVRVSDRPPAKTSEPPPARRSDRPPPKTSEPPPARRSDRPPAKASDRPPPKDGPGEVGPDKLFVDKALPELLSPKLPAVVEEPRRDSVAPAERVSKPAPSASRARSAPSESSSDAGPPSIPPSRRSSAEPYSDPQYSVPTRRAGAARWIVGFVLLGCTALAAVTIGPKVLQTKPVPSAAAPQDNRILLLLDEGDRAANAGDLEAAKEAYVKASALADKDVRIELRLARLAITRADVPWLKARLLTDADPDVGNTKRELELAADRARQATDRAQAIAANDPDVTRCRIDTLRLLGNLAEARKLVATLPKSTGISKDDLLFALLDLAEASPNWATVIERLTEAARGEQNLGRARAMLIYALVRSGDIKRAKTELDTLVALPRPHPLIGEFRAFITRAESAPENPPGAEEDAGTPEEDAAAPGDDNAAVQVAIEAINKGEYERATNLLQELEGRLPNDPNVLTASGHLAMKKKERVAAVKYYEKALAADKMHLDAMAALADIKWDSGEKQGASLLYRQIIERGGNDNPHLTHAKQRFAAYTERMMSGEEFGQP